MDTETRVRLLAEVSRAREQLQGARDEEARADRRWKTLIRRAVAEGVPRRDVAEAAGVSRVRVSQIVPKGTAAQAGETEAAAEHVAALNTPDATVPELPGDQAAVVSGATRGERAHYGRRPVIFYDHAAGLGVSVEHGPVRSGMADTGSVPAVLDIAALVAGRAHGHVRVYLSGAAPGEAGLPAAERVRAWALSDPGPGWRTAERGHYLADADAPVCRWQHEGSRLVVEVHRAASWFGETLAKPPVLADAWRVLNDAIGNAFPGGLLLATPSTTGRDLWRRTIGPKQSWPVLSGELRELLASTAGQGRIELVDAPDSAAEVPGFTYYDGRLMYAALTWGMPVGEPTLHRAAPLASLTDEEAERLLAGRGRWRVTARVPHGWGRVGLLMAPDGAGGWHYPREWGQTFTTWADGSEVLLARRWGWQIATHQGITWREGKPLNAWRDRLVRLWEWAHDAAQPDVGGELAQLVADAVRRMLLFGIGAFAARGHASTHTAPADQPGRVPEGVPVRVVGDQLVWQQPGELGEWSAAMAHPEWAACIWARARVRLLDAPGPAGTERVGALHVPAPDVIGFRTDALYLAHDPEWPDDGAVGRFRVKGRLHQPVPWPANVAELLALRDESEGNHL